jgi:uncharacterized phage infection (PIP) family protein YhgE
VISRPSSVKSDSGSAQLRNGSLSLQGGLSRLAEAAKTVARLNEQANERRQKLTTKQEEVHAAMKDIETAMEAAGSRKTEVEALSVKQAREHEAVLQRKVCGSLQQQRRHHEPNLLKLLGRLLSGSASKLF